MNPITWQNDPLLFDAEPRPVNQWINANELIQQKRREEIFLSDRLLNLFPIMVRRNDFVREKPSDRIIARFPFVIINEDAQELIKNKILLLSELTRDYFYKSINKSILQWRDDIQKYLDRGAIPYPIIRCSFELEASLLPLINDDVCLRFSSIRGEEFKMPTKLSKELAYLAGMVNGDGNLQKYTLRIVDYSIKNIEQLKSMFQEYFDQTGNILFKTPNSPEVVITNLWVVRLFSFLTGQLIGTRKYDALREPHIFKHNPTFRSYYWSGVMDADGSYRNRNVKFVSTSLNYVKDFKEFLIENEIESKLTEREDNTVVLYIPAIFYVQLSNLLICLHPEKKTDFNKLIFIPNRNASFFIGFKEPSLINGYFDFRLIENLSVTNIGDTIRQLRGKQTRKAFIEKAPISERSLQDIEKGKMSINIMLLDKILKLYNQQLMPFLSQQEISLYHIRGSTPIKLSTQPNTKLSSLLKPLYIYKRFLKIPENNDRLARDLENYFQITIKNNQITNKLFLKFIYTYCEIKSQENL